MLSKLLFIPTLFSCLLIGVAAQAQERLPVIAHMFPNGSPPDRAAVKFAENLTALSADQVRVVGRALLGDEQQNFKDLGKDEISYAITGDLLISTVAPSFAAVNLPFTQTSMDHSLEPFRSPKTYPRFQEILAQYGVRHLATLCLGTRYLTANSRINSIDGLKGLKLRLPNDRVWSTVWEALGASTINVPFPELKTTLGSGLVDAQENPPALIRAANLNETQKYLIQTKHYYQRQFILVSSAYFDSMNRTQQNLVTNAAWKTADEACEETQEAERNAINWLVTEGGMELVDFHIDGISKIVRDTYHNYLSDNSDSEIESIFGLR